MTKIIVVNDTGAVIPAGTVITLDGSMSCGPVAEIVSCSHVTAFNAAATTASATVSASVTATATYSAGAYVYLNAEDSIKFGQALNVYESLILDVNLKGDLVRPT